MNGHVPTGAIRKTAKVITTGRCEAAAAAVGTPPGTDHNGRLPADGPVAGPLTWWTPTA